MKNRKLLAAAILAVIGVGAFARTLERAKPSGHVRWCGFNLLGMFCQTRQAQGDARIAGYFPEDHFQWMREWGFNFARLPLDYRYFVEKGDWMKPVEAQLGKLDEAGVEKLFYTHLTGVVRDGERITAAIVDCLEGPRAIRAKVFIDATGSAKNFIA